MSVPFEYDDDPQLPPDDGPDSPLPRDPQLGINRDGDLEPAAADEGSESPEPRAKLPAPPRAHKASRPTIDWRPHDRGYDQD